MYKNFALSMRIGQAIVQRGSGLGSGARGAMQGYLNSLTFSCLDAAPQERRAAAPDCLRRFFHSGSWRRRVISRALGMWQSEPQ